MTNLLECEACPNQVTEGKLSTVQTNKGPMKLCPSCTTSHAFGKLQLAQSVKELSTPEPLPVQADKELQLLSNSGVDTNCGACMEVAYTGVTTNSHTCRSNASPVLAPVLGNESATNPPKDRTDPRFHGSIQAPLLTNPQSVPDPSGTGKKMKLSELFTLALTNANAKICEFDYEKDGYARLEEWIQKLEAIAFEAKTMAGVGHSKKRELDAKSGKNRWDKERANRPSSTGNLADPREKNTYNRKKESHAKSLTKLETIVKGLIELGYSDDEIMEQCPEGKFKGHEVREAIGKMKA